MFPAEREKFEEWKLKMEAHLNARDVLDVVLSPSTAITHTRRLSPTEHTQWMKECKQRGEKADQLLRDARGNKQKTDEVLQEANVIFKQELIKCRRAYDILLSSFQSKQMNVINSVFPGNAHEVWSVINSAYGIINTTDTIDSLLTQLHGLEKKDNERVSEYIAHIDKIILQLNNLQSPVNARMKKFYILHGLRNIPQWKMHAIIIQKLDSDGSWSVDKLEQYLVSEENKQQVHKEGKNDEAGESALSTVSNNNNNNQNYNNNTNPFYSRGRVQFRSRGMYRGRGNYFRGGRSGNRNRGGYDGRTHSSYNNGYNNNHSGHNGQTQTSYNNDDDEDTHTHNKNQQHNHDNNNDADTHAHTNNQSNVNNHQSNDTLDSATCFNCGGKGHTQRICPSKRMRTSSYAAITTQSNDDDDLPF